MPFPRKRRRPASRHSGLYGAIDLGTNSCRMLIAAPDGSRFRIIDAFSKPVRLGQDLEETGRLSEAAIERTIKALNVCAAKLRKHGVKRRRLVATAACRRAANGRDFLAEARRETGLNLELIKPEEEARLAVISTAPLIEPETRQVLIVDIGGGSTELVWIDVSRVAPADRARAVMRLVPGEARNAENVAPEGAEVIDWVSVPLGVSTLHQRYADVEEDRARFALMAWYFEEHLTEFRPYLDADAEEMLQGLQVIGTSGTITTIAAAHLGLRRYDRAKVDGLWMSSDQIGTVMEGFLAMGRAGRAAHPGLGPERADFSLSGAAILQTILSIWPAPHLRVADRGLREGLLYSMMGADGVLTGEVV
ncbi:MAG: Ppx/GppA phosphatase family protein [Pseudomonadota bacterium]